MNSSQCSNSVELTYFFILTFTGVAAILCALLAPIFLKENKEKITGSDVFGLLFYIFSSKGLDYKGRTWRILFIVSWVSTFILYFLGSNFNYCV